MECLRLGEKTCQVDVVFVHPRTNPTPLACLAARFMSIHGGHIFASIRTLRDLQLQRDKFVAMKTSFLAKACADAGAIFERPPEEQSQVQGLKEVLVELARSGKAVA